MTKKRPCPNCGNSVNGRPNKIFCDVGCANAWHQAKSRAARGGTIRRRSKLNSSPVPETNAPITSNLAARVLADGFYLGSLAEEISQIKKSKTAVRALHGILRQAIVNDALWPPSGPGRIALVIHLIENPSLLEISVRWRHPHEHRPMQGEQRKKPALQMRVGRI